MNNLIKAEMYKLQRNKTFWVIIGIVLALSTLLHVLIMIDWWMMGGTPFESAGLSEFNALSAFTVPLFFNLIVSTLAGFFVSIEFSSNGAIKNQIISGNRRSQIFLAKYFVFSLGAFIVTILIPLLAAILLAILFGHGDIFTISNIAYLVRAYVLFTLQFLGFTASVLLIAVITEDSGKTIIFSILFTIVMFIVELLVLPRFMEIVYEYSIFYQFGEVFNYVVTNGEILKSIMIGLVTTFVLLLCGIFVFNRKEIK